MMDAAIHMTVVRYYAPTSRLTSDETSNETSVEAVSGVDIDSKQK